MANSAIPFPKTLMKPSLQNRICRSALPALLLTLCLLLVSADAGASSIIYIGKSQPISPTLRQLQSAAEFYGLDVTDIQPNLESASLTRAIHGKDVVAVVLDANALSSINEKQLLTGLGVSHPVPLLIAGISEKQDAGQLVEWSAGAITRCQSSEAGAMPLWYEVADVADIARQLKGTHLPRAQGKVTYLSMKSGEAGQWLLAARDGGATLPVFARVKHGAQEIFFATEQMPITVPVSVDPFRQQSMFSNLAVPFMFLRYAAGDRAWHTTGDYANLTIDDGWLREPYGNVNYEGLLREMEIHNFHTTMAFIPWNYDRSEPKMVSLFRDHPDRFSICIHGNNHVHQEFGPLDKHPLDKQIANIKQALARMEKFHNLTSIAYDRVMVFPHSVAPTATFLELRRYNYLATANSLNIPSDATSDTGTELGLRTSTLQFAGFPSMRRYSAEVGIAEPQLAIDAFLGNPMLFYVHEGYFAGGMGAFDRTADLVNHIQPSTQWRGLGYIAEHGYFERMRNDGNYDIKLNTAVATLQNSHRQDAVFFIEKDEDFTLPLTVIVNGQTYPFQRKGRMLQISVSIPAGQTRNVSVQYTGELNPTSVDVSKRSPYVATIRLLSDFRDDVVSKSQIGRRFIRSYTDASTRWNIAASVVACLMFLPLILWFRRRRRTGAQASVASIPVGQMSSAQQSHTASPL